MHRVDAHVAAAELLGRRLGHAAHGPFAGAVGERPHRAHEACDRADVDDRTGFGIRHGGPDLLHAQKHAAGVDSQHAVVVSHRGVHEASSLEDARVVHQDIDAAVPAHDVGNHRVPIGLGGHVVMQVLAAHLGGGLPAFVVEHVGEHHRRALVNKELALDGTLPSCAAGDDRNPSVQNAHLLSPRVKCDRRGRSGPRRARARATARP